MKTIRVGLIGAGLIGKLHAKNLINMPNVELSMISDLYVDNMQDWIQSIGVENVSKDYRDILSNPEIDTVFVCSPPETHAEIIIAAAKAGKHIFCEKPVSLDLDETRRVIDVINENGVKMQVGFMRRFDHNFSRIHELIQAGEIGRPHIIKITSRDPHPPQTYTILQGVIFLETTIHDYDMARFLAGSEVTEVYADGSIFIDPKFAEYGDVDTAITVLRFANDVLCVIDNSRKSDYGYDQRVEVFGSKGSVAVDNDFHNSAIVSTSEGLRRDKPVKFFQERYIDAYKKEAEIFFDCIRNQTEVPVTAYDGLQNELIAHAARKSLKERRPVKIEELIPAKYS